jgi:hypothetical protein
MIVFLLALAIAALTGWLVQAVAGGSIDRVVSAFRELVGGWRPDRWPRGVQEEDRDKPWGTGIAETIKPIVQAVATSPLKAKTRAR